MHFCRQFHHRHQVYAMERVQMAQQRVVVAQRQRHTPNQQQAIDAPPIYADVVAADQAELPSFYEATKSRASDQQSIGEGKPPSYQEAIGDSASDVKSKV